MTILDELIKEGLFLSSSNFNPSYTKRFFNTITKEREEWYNSLEGDSLSEKIYLLINNKTKPKCCYCGNPVKFISFNHGYRLYCSVSCKAQYLAPKVAETNLKKYGVKAPAQNKEVQEKIKQTCLSRFGVDNVFRDIEKIKEAVIQKYGKHPSQTEEVKQKTKLTCMEKYGVPVSTQSEEVKNKRARTNIEKYGNICSLHGEEIQKKVKEVKTKAYISKLFSSERILNIAQPLFTEKEYKGNIDSNGVPIYYQWKCIKCNNTFSDNIANGKVPRCSKCYPPKIQGIFEKELVDWLKEILPNEELLLNTRRIIPPLELDIYLPKFKLAIEFNEVYWHSELTSKGVRNQNYHIGKSNQCIEQGISLIHIWDSEWFNYKNIIKSLIKNRLGIHQRKIGARECIIQDVSNEESKGFLNDNHIQGFAPASYRKGLYFNKELVALLAVAKNRFKRETYEIVRYTTKLDCSIQGGLSRLWKYIQNEIPKPFTLISYVDKRLFTGLSNKSIGLEFSHSNKPSYFYTKDYKTLLNRMNFQKKNIKKYMKYEDSLTEWENMQLNGYDRVWDCGTDVWIKTF
jgi:hypothetical protein